MFCPKCKCEYREGFTVCSDCGCSLVEKLPPEEEQSPEKAEYIDLEFVFSTLKYTEIAQIKAVFDAEGIKYFIQGEDIGITPGGIEARVLVMKEQAEEARTLINEFVLGGK